MQSNAKVENIEGHSSVDLIEARSLASIAVSLKRIADRLDGMELDGFGNQLLDIAYKAGLNFRGQANA